MFLLLSERGLESSLVVTSDKNSLALRATKNLKRASGMAVGDSVFMSHLNENLIIEVSIRLFSKG